jgi:hypothetical protein
MTTQEALTIRKYAEGAYPQLKSNDGSDLVWVDLLAEYGALGIMKVLKDYIKTGNKFPPTVSELINKYQTVIPDFEESVLQLMLESGEFDDQVGHDEIRLQNRNNRVKKMREWISRGYMPDCEKATYERYKDMLTQKYFAPKTTQHQIGRGE